MSNFEVYFRDLNEEAKKRFLDFEKMNDAREGNYDVFPIFVFESE